MPPEPQCLRILHVILSRGFAGSERAAAEACNSLSQQHEVAIIVRRDHRSAGGASICDHLDPRVRPFEVPPHWRTQAALGQVIRDWKPDVIHTHLRRGTRLVARLRSGVPHVATLHVGLNGAHYLMADALVCIADWQVSSVRKAGYPGRVLRIPNSLVPHPRIDQGRRASLRGLAGASPSDFLIGGVGRLTESKGFDVLIDAFREAALPDARLVIVGEGGERRRLEARAAGLKVTFTGFRKDVKDWFQALDLFVSPSRREPFGRVIIEALDAGTPVIASDAMGPREIAANHPIEIVPAERVHELAEALRRAYARPRVRLSADLREFHVDRISQQLLEAYSLAGGTADTRRGATG